MAGREPATRRSIDITRQQSWSETSPTDERPQTPDLESQHKRGWIRVAQQQQRDPRHMVAPRCLAITGACVLYRTSHVIALDQPNKSFLSNLLATWETLLGPEDEGILVDEMERDWVSLSQPDILDQVISLIPTTDLGQRMFRPFLVEEENIGENNDMLHYREGWIRTLIVGGISVIIGVFACAPVAIQSLNVKSAGGEVATYLVFMIVFGLLSQALLHGFEKILLACLAYASVMATVMRQGQ
ncbi:uncharacterized protein NECHADRAFT_101639 [Fusarium vanettenii 77-13-4]|uniref:Uncharacterized protein n=1 Tax=Fusarium vanettenii (strain ATCC MYA-4622 / CBS 123669 / FGSC 9596 / NRRL 45880 / 77-13-4) TaxID=660122 RepID=C7YU66_FUSV7|nr:uncharacterized protein NECHADRAFT_101639 [Fusarium vanettenii 77-13-4]EEU44362.1 hypothetical protein NECHADRAFT_101639 [Fusarium vanettenii 77-13-4]